tara:strand:- start:80 stop:715 length:636 start_codon:yes stop_codon:yes gene_type:complete
MRLISVKRGAMFGLDARITLAIFGALSVISGAALYSAILNSKATALLSELIEAGKAWEQYYLDTGQSLSRLGADPAVGLFYNFNTSELNVDNGASGWKGPYLSYSFINGAFAEHPIYGNMHLLAFNNKTWGGNYDPRVVNSSNGQCLAGDTCYLWSHFHTITNLSLIKNIDELVDNGDGADSGNFRWNEFSGISGSNRVYLKIAPIKNPNG